MSDLEIADYIFKKSHMDGYADDKWNLANSLKPVLENDRCYVLLVANSCLFIFIPRAFSSYEGHACILKEFRGKIGVEIGKAAIKWMFDNTNCIKIVSFIPSFNRRAVFYAISLGMKVEGRIKNSVLINNQLYDEIVVGLCKEVI